MIKDYLRMFEQDRDFRSRTGKKEFWRAALPDLLLWIILIVCYFVFPEINLLYVTLAALYLIVTLTARLALWVRRLHDTGVNGTFIFVIFIPVLGILALCFLFLSDSQPKDNVFGPYQPEPEKKKKSRKKTK